MKLIGGGEMWVSLPKYPSAMASVASGSSAADHRESIFGLVLGVIIVGVLWFLTVLIFNWIWLIPFVQGAKYDYVTTSSILFCIYVIPAVLVAIVLAFVSKFRIDTVLILLLYLIVYPLFVSSSLRIFEMIWRPEISDQLNIVAIYRTIPAGIAKFAAGILPATSSSVDYFDRHPTALALTSSITSVALLRAFPRLWGWKRI